MPPALLFVPSKPIIVAMRFIKLLCITLLNFLSAALHHCRCWHRILFRCFFSAHFTEIDSRQISLRVAMNIGRRVGSSTYNVSQLTAFKCTWTAFASFRYCIVLLFMHICIYTHIYIHKYTYNYMLCIYIYIYNMIYVYVYINKHLSCLCCIMYELYSMLMC